MKTMAWMLVIAMSLVGCGSGPTHPKLTQDSEDWSFPAGGTEAAATMIAQAAAVQVDTVKAGGQFDLKFVCYNVSGMYGSTVRLEYDAERVRIDQVITGPFAGGAHGIAVGRADESEGVVRFASTYTDSTQSSSGSGVLFKLKCTALTTGRSRFRIRGSDLSFVVRSGADVPDLPRIRPEDRTVTIVP